MLLKTTCAVLALSLPSFCDDFEDAVNEALAEAEANGEGITSWRDDQIDADAGWDTERDEFVFDSEHIRQTIGPGGFNNPDALRGFIKGILPHELRHRNDCTLHPPGSTERDCQHFAQFVADYNEACSKASMFRDEYCAAWDLYNQCVVDGNGGCEALLNDYIAKFNKWLGQCAAADSFADDVADGSSWFTGNCAGMTSFGCTPPLGVPTPDADGDYITTPCSGCGPGC